MWRCDRAGGGNCRCNSSCATPWWPRKRPALLDRPVSIVAVPPRLIFQREREKEREGAAGGIDPRSGAWIQSCLGTEEIICFAISGDNKKGEGNVPWWSRRVTTGIDVHRWDAVWNDESIWGGWLTFTSVLEQLIFKTTFTLLTNTLL